MVSRLEVDAKYAQLRRSARRRGLDFNLSHRNVKQLLTQTECVYSGEEFGTDGEEVLSVERINPLRGYVKGNVVSVKKKYNSARSNDVSSHDSYARIREMKERLKSRQNSFEKDTKAYNGLDNEIVTIESKITDLKKQIKTLEARLPSKKNKLNNIKQTLDNTAKNIHNLEHHIEKLTLVADSVARLEDEQQKTWLGKIKKFFRGY